MTDYAGLAAEIHASNVAAGWWPADPSQRNRGEVMMLVVSELAEAAEGLIADCADDKLPHLPMYDVELADTAIRLYDLIGADAMDRAWDSPQLPCVTYRLQDVVCIVAAAMEGHRKGRMQEYGDRLWDALFAVYVLAKQDDIDLDAVIAEKRAFNATRADHQIGNRLKVGGKRY